MQHHRYIDAEGWQNLLLFVRGVAEVDAENKARQAKEATRSEVNDKLQMVSGGKDATTR